MNSTGCDLSDSKSTIYFLHIQKCAGTTLRLIFENTYPADKVMAAHREIYYVHELADYKSLRQTYSLYRGHFGWTLLAMLPNREWNVFTVLREPVDRFLSLYYYRKQHNRLPASLSLENWLDNKVLAKDTMVSYFLSDVAGLTSRSSEAIPDLIRPRLPEALANLEKCRAVGISEALDDTINLFSWLLGILPPQRTARYNPTLSRMKSSDLPTAASAGGITWPLRIV